MNKEKLKTPEEMAQKEVNKKLAKAIAERQLEIKRHEAKIKKLQKEIKKINDGELVPDVDEESDSSSSSERIVERTIIKEVSTKSDDYGYYITPKKKKTFDYAYYPYWSGSKTGYRYK